MKGGEFFDPKRYLVVTEKEKEENIVCVYTCISVKHIHEIGDTV